MYVVSDVDDSRPPQPPASPCSQGSWSTYRTQSSSLGQVVHVSLGISTLLWSRSSPTSNRWPVGPDSFHPRWLLDFLPSTWVVLTPSTFLFPRWPPKVSEWRGRSGSISQLGLVDGLAFCPVVGRSNLPRLQRWRRRTYVGCVRDDVGIVNATRPDPRPRPSVVRRSRRGGVTSVRPSGTPPPHRSDSSQKLITYLGLWHSRLYFDTYTKVNWSSEKLNRLLLVFSVPRTVSKVGPQYL